MKGSTPAASVTELLHEAKARGVNAAYVEIETFDALLLRLWRNIEGKPAEMDAKVRKAVPAAVNIALPPAGTQNPVIRLNALPLLSLPAQCLSLSFGHPKSWDELRSARNAAKAALILAKSPEGAWCWGSEQSAKETYGADLLSVEPAELPADLTRPDSLYLRGFVEEGMCAALARDKPLLTRTTRTGSFIIANPQAATAAALAPLIGVVKSAAGQIAGLKTVATPTHPAEQVRWAEALRLALEIKDGKPWLLIEPEIWIWPSYARREAINFLDQRRADRYNSKHDALLTAWIRIILGTDQLNAAVTVAAFDAASDAANPSFQIGSRTAFSRRSVA
jgi:hypothetical protein